MNELNYEAKVDPKFHVQDFDNKAFFKKDDMDE